MTCSVRLSELLLLLFFFFLLQCTVKATVALMLLRIEIFIGCAVVHYPQPRPNPTEDGKSPTRPAVPRLPLLTN